MYWIQKIPKNEPRLSKLFVKNGRDASLLRVKYAVACVQPPLPASDLSEGRGGCTQAKYAVKYSWQAQCGDLVDKVSGGSRP